MLEKDALLKLCPVEKINSKTCVTGKCMFWVYTKIDASFTTETETCRCGESTNHHYSCQRCGGRPGDSSGQVIVTTYREGVELEDGYKEGYCKELCNH
jgi:hypothetical protein